MSSSSSSSSSTHKHDDNQSNTQTLGATKPPPDSSIDKPLEDTNTVNDNGEQIEGREEEQEEGECGFCLFMKGGGCKESFITWENCVEEAEKTKEDVVEKCFEVTSTLRKCMQAHADYYEPILLAEKAAEEEAVRELEKERLDNQKGESSENAVLAN